MRGLTFGSRIYFWQQFQRESDSGTHWNLRTYNAVSAVEILAVEMHTAASASLRTGMATSQFANDGFRGHSHHVSPAVIAVSSDHLVTLHHTCLHTNTAGFLADVQVQEAANELLLIQGIARLLHSADGIHLRVVMQCLILGHYRFGHRAFLQLVQLERLPKAVKRELHWAYLL